MKGVTRVLILSSRVFFLFFFVVRRVYNIYKEQVFPLDLRRRRVRVAAAVKKTNNSYQAL